MYRFSLLSGDCQFRSQCPSTPAALTAVKYNHSKTALSVWSRLFIQRHRCMVSHENYTNLLYTWHTESPPLITHITHRRGFVWRIAAASYSVYLSGNNRWMHYICIFSPLYFRASVWEATLDVWESCAPPQLLPSLGFSCTLYSPQSRESSASMPSIIDLVLPHVWDKIFILSAWNSSPTYVLARYSAKTEGMFCFEVRNFQTQFYWRILL